MIITSLDQEEQEFFMTKYGITRQELFEACKIHTRSGMSHSKAIKVIQARKIEKQLLSANVEMNHRPKD